VLSSFAFTKKQRLLTAAEYTSVFEKGKRYPLSAGLYLVLPTEHVCARLGLVVAKKRLAKAVQRNYLKRCQREGFRLMSAKMLACDIVFLANHRVTKLNRRQMHSCCERDWLKLSALLPALVVG
jgi:ribonuclease P protein component